MLPSGVNSSEHDRIQSTADPQKRKSLTRLRRHSLHSKRQRHGQCRGPRIPQELDCGEIQSRIQLQSLHQCRTMLSSHLMSKDAADVS